MTGWRNKNQINSLLNINDSLFISFYFACLMMPMKLTWRMEHITFLNKINDLRWLCTRKKEKKYKWKLWEKMESVQFKSRWKKKFKKKCLFNISELVNVSGIFSNASVWKRSGFFSLFTFDFFFLRQCNGIGKERKKKC